MVWGTESTAISAEGSSILRTEWNIQITCARRHENPVDGIKKKTRESTLCRATLICECPWRNNGASWAWWDGRNSKMFTFAWSYIWNVTIGEFSNKCFVSVALKSALSAIRCFSQSNYICWSKTRWPSLRLTADCSCFYLHTVRFNHYVRCICFSQQWEQLKWPWGTVNNVGGDNA